MVRIERHRTRHRWLVLIVALLATMGQLAVASSALAEGRGSRMASHVEASGAAGHFAHDEARCISCQARTFHGTVERPAQPPIRLAIRPMPEIARDARVRSASVHLSSNPRAPPVVS